MTNILQTLESNNLIHPPKYLVHATQYLTRMGSVAYGVSTDLSDQDIYGWCIPPKEDVFPHLRGEIIGFGRQKQRFEQWQEHHILYNEKSYDLAVYSIVRFFDLAMQNNPNMVDAMFTPLNQVIHITQLGQMVREKRRLFLHKGSWHKFKGYAFSQMSKLNRNPDGNRKALVDKYGFDTKSAYHVVRLMDEVEQILTTGDLDLTRNAAQLKEIRAGAWTEQQVRDHFAMKEKTLEEVYANSKLPYGPPEDEIKTLLLECLEHHYGSLGAAVYVEGKERVALQRILELAEEGLK